MLHKPVSKKKCVSYRFTNPFLSRITLVIKKKKMALEQTKAWKQMPSSVSSRSLSIGAMMPPRKTISLNTKFQKIRVPDKLESLFYMYYNSLIRAFLRKSLIDLAIIVISVRSKSPRGHLKIE